MKKKVKRGLEALRYAALALLVAVFALLSVPVVPRVVKSAPANSTERTAEPKNAALPASYSSVTINCYYYRKDESYTNYNIWMWATGGAGKRYSFKEETVEFPSYPDKHWAVSTVTLTDVKPSANGDIAGVIYRSGGTNVADTEWGSDSDVKKDSGDLMVSAYELDENNEVSVYFVSGGKMLFYTPEDAMSNKINEAFFKDKNTVSIYTTAAITEKSYFKVIKGEDEVIGVYDCSADEEDENVGGFSLEITISEDIDFTKSYKVVDEPAEFDRDVNFVGRSVLKNSYYGTSEFEEEYAYSGTLGAEYSAAKTKFTVWSPSASAISVNIYDAGEGGAATVYDMTKGEKGAWSVEVAGDLKNKYYTYSVTNGVSPVETVDPYARSGGKNGLRGMILDLASTNPEGWDTQSIPDYGTTAQALASAVIYEAHLRDLTIHESSNVTAANRGKFLGMTEMGTEAAPTPLRYLKELGVTAVHFQPLFDFKTVDENFTTATYNKDGEFNWGYDPLNYNMPEGSYSSDPSDGFKRVNEMKQMIMALHNAGIQVVMDVVYNHVADANGSNFEALMPGYYFRTDSNGTLYNGSGCGNETASERYMFRRFMVDSVKYWAEEYKVDGFRFDLMGLHDTDTMNEIYDAVKEINPDVMIYGEGWTGGQSGLEGGAAATQKNAKYMPNIAVFNDIIRDAVKGGVFDIGEAGFVNGNRAGTDTGIYVGAVGGSDITSAGYTSINKSPFASNPVQSINYVSCHDNSALWDKLNASVPAETDVKVLRAMNRLAATSVLTSQGAAFFLAGEEMLRSKPTTETNSYDNRPKAYKTNPEYFFSDNSYKSPDSVNAIDWSKLSDPDIAAMVEYYKTLIKIKKTFPEFQLTTTKQVKSSIVVKDTDRSDGVAVYALKAASGNGCIVVAYNANATKMNVSIPKGKYGVIVNGEKATADRTKPLSNVNGSSITVDPYSAMILVGESEAATVSKWKYKADEAKASDDSGVGLAVGLGVGIPAGVLVLGGAAAAVYLTKKKGKKSGKKEEPESDDKKEPEEQPEAEKEPEEQPQEEPVNVENPDTEE